MTMMSDAQTTYVEPPVRYRHWSGRAAYLPRSRDLRDAWPEVTRTLQDGFIITVRPAGRSGWVDLGFAPRSRNRWRRFWRHWHHGRLMGYPRLSVLVFCVTAFRTKLPKVD